MQGVGGTGARVPSIRKSPLGSSGTGSELCITPGAGPQNNLARTLSIPIGADGVAASEQKAPAINRDPAIGLYVYGQAGNDPWLPARVHTANDVRRRTRPDRNHADAAIEAHQRSLSAGREREQQGGRKQTSRECLFHDVLAYKMKSTTAQGTTPPAEPLFRYRVQIFAEVLRCAKHEPSCDKKTSTRLVCCALANVHDRNVVGIEALPAGQPVEQRDCGPAWCEECRGDLMLVEQVEKTRQVLQRHGAMVTCDEGSTIKLRSSVDEGSHAGRGSKKPPKS